MADCGPECQETLRAIERFLDDEVDQVMRVKIEHHLSDCGPCTDHAAFAKRLKDLVHSKCAERELPPGLRDRLHGMLSTLDAAGE